MNNRDLLELAASAFHVFTMIPPPPLLDEVFGMVEIILPYGHNIVMNFGLSPEKLRKLFSRYLIQYIMTSSLIEEDIGRYHQQTNCYLQCYGSDNIRNTVC